jgi:RNA polymerase sigma-70 factor (ECF subfamily)
VAHRQDEFEQLAIPHLRNLLRVAQRLTSRQEIAEDLVQETFLLAWRSFHQFERGTNMRAWLFRILFNVFYAEGRRARVAPSLVPLPPAESDSGRPLRVAPVAAENAGIARALAELSPEHRTVLLLNVVEGFTCEEIAAILNVPIGTVMSRLSRARQAMRNRLRPAGVRYAGTEDK